MWMSRIRHKVIDKGFNNEENKHQPIKIKFT